MSGSEAASRFRVAVIGKGLIGAAAARHLAGQTDGVALIGPDEPAVRAEHHDVFGSHYDEGRITRILDSDEIWGRLAARSIARYAEIEAQSGIPFYQEVGMLAASAPDGLIQRYARTGEALGVEFDRLTAAELAQRFPYLHFPPGFAGVFQPRQAGHVSPRRLVAAQTAAAERQGATIIPEPVHRLGFDRETVVLTTATGRQVRAERVLVATGGFANAHEVLPRKLAITVRGRTIVLAEIPAALLGSLRAMPSLIADGTAPLDDPYVLPPIQYPDGRWYIKLGTGEFEHRLDTLDELVAWFQRPGAEQDRDALHQTLLGLIPELAGAPIHTDTCAVTATVSGYPYVDLIENGRIGIAVGGNGQAAKSSDEIGRLAAVLVLTGKWGDDLPADAFHGHFRD
ncbi:MAG TPA: FAD-dependent oxidoreductase [Thermomicrobiaceae bacterium]|nr:FAD-dependent oxidoreductase [Thermomicrobiaceae bacterium]